MKKYLPFILLLAGIAVVVGAFLVVRGRKKGGFEEEESALIDVALKDRPVVSLTPTDDGHYLNLKIDKIVVKAESLDYELLYKTGTGITQGVPGTIDLKGKDSFETELLLGSESSGKFRYDEGVEEGSFTIRFRNEKGKLLAKFSTDFHLQESEKELTSLDNKFTYTFSKTPKEGFFVTMETFGFPKDPGGEVVAGPYGVFSSSDQAQPGTVAMEGGNISAWNGKSWDKLEGYESSDIGIFVAVGE